MISSQDRSLIPAAVTRLLPPVLSSPERELLLRCARVQLDEPTAGEVRALCAAEPDWRALRKLAQAHQVSPFLYHTLGRVCPDLVPEGELARLRDRYHANVAHNLQLEHGLAEVVRLLKRHDLPVIALKGAALARQAYADPSLRVYRDLDLLVRREDALRAREVLEAHGYHSFPKLNAVQQRVFLRSECEFWFESPGEVFPLEVHWDLRESVYAYRLDTQKCWARREQLQIAGQPVAVLGAEDTLLMLSCHGAKHRWGHLKLLCDIAELMRTHPALDWERLFSRAEGLRGQRMLGLCLRLAGTLLGVPLPNCVEERLRADRHLTSLEKDVTAYLFDLKRTGRQAVSGTRLYLRMRERPQERLRYVLGTLFTPTLEDWRVLDLPEPLFPLYYLVRPVRLLRRAVTENRFKNRTGDEPSASRF